MEIARCGVGLKLATGLWRYSHLKRHVLTCRWAQKIVRCRGRRGRDTFGVRLSECGGDFCHLSDLVVRDLGDGVDDVLDGGISALVESRVDGFGDGAACIACASVGDALRHRTRDSSVPCRFDVCPGVLYLDLAVANTPQDKSEPFRVNAVLMGQFVSKANLWMKIVHGQARGEYQKSDVRAISRVALLAWGAPSKTTRSNFSVAVKAVLRLVNTSV